MSTSNIPVIAIDGPTASGKGTVAHRVADKLGFHYLDSGALYRLTALSALRRGTDLRDEHALAKLAEHLPCHFAGGEILLAQENVTEQIRAEEVGNTASKIAVLPTVRHALVGLQLGFRKTPGLVADGRDMGTVIFPQAQLKVFLTASVEARLGESAYCAGKNYTLADVAVGCALGWLSFRFPEIDWRAEHPALARLFDKLSERPSFRDTVPQ